MDDMESLCQRHYKDLLSYKESINKLMPSLTSSCTKEINSLPL